jgi:hypothetical protein
MGISRLISADDFNVYRSFVSCDDFTGLFVNKLVIRLQSISLMNIWLCLVSVDRYFLTTKEQGKNKFAYCTAIDLWPLLAIIHASPVF